MKNFKIYRRSFAILSATALVLFSGYSGIKTKANNDVKKAESCKNLTTYFGEQPIIFKKRNDYKILALVDSGEQNIKIYQKKRWNNKNY